MGSSNCFPLAGYKLLVSRRFSSSALTWRGGAMAGPCVTCGAFLGCNTSWLTRFALLMQLSVPYTSRGQGGCSGPDRIGLNIQRHHGSEGVSWAAKTRRHKRNAFRAFPVAGRIQICEADLHGMMESPQTSRSSDPPLIGPWYRSLQSLQGPCW